MSNKNKAFTGTCSKCKAKKVTVIKVLEGQMCVDKCLKESAQRYGPASDLNVKR